MSALKFRKAIIHFCTTITSQHKKNAGLEALELQWQAVSFVKADENLVKGETQTQL